MDKPTHRETCRAAARLLLAEPWADAVCWEVGSAVGQLDLLAVTGSTTEEKHRKAVERWERRGARPEDRPRHTVPRILVGEVKMSREDLRAGLRRSQLDLYQRDPVVKGSHFLLVVWEEVLDPPAKGWWSTEDTETALARLRLMGVPDTWGIARAHLSQGRRKEIMVSVLRRPPRLNDGGPLLHRLTLIEKMARSFSYRVLSRTSPEDETRE